MWQKHYCDLFNCVKSSIFAVGEIDNKGDVVVSSREIYDASRNLKVVRHVGWIRYLLTQGFPNLW